MSLPECYYTSSLKTDSISVVYNCQSESGIPLDPVIDTSLYKFDLFEQKRILSAYVNPDFPVYPNTELLEFDFNRDNFNSFLLTASFGLGKSFQICRIKEFDPEAVILTYTHANVERFKIDGIEAKTIHSFFGLNESGSGENESESEGVKKVKVNSVSRIIIDEFSMISADLWRHFAIYKKDNPDCIFQMFGDENQTKNMSDKIKMRESKTDLIVRYLCDGNIRFIKEHSNMRCDMKLYNEIQEFYKTGIIGNAFKGRKLVPELETTLTTRRKQNDVINERMNEGGL